MTLPWMDVLLLCCAQPCPTLCSPTVCSPPGSSVHGISQARILEWVASSYPRRSSWPRDQTHISCVSFTGMQILYQWTNPLGISQTPSIAVMLAESFQGKAQKPWPILIWPGRNMQTDFERLSSKWAKTVWKPGCEAMWSRREGGTPKIDWTCFNAILC